MPAFAQVPSDTTLETNLESEALPTTNPWSYRWEALRNRVASVFILNAERQTQHYLNRLHQLDRKLAACAELGDEECVAQVEQDMAAVRTQAENYIANQAEVRERYLERFQDWRAQRQALITERRQRASEFNMPSPQLRFQPWLQESSQPAAPTNAPGSGEFRNQRLDSYQEQFENTQIQPPAAGGRLFGSQPTPPPDPN